MEDTGLRYVTWRGREVLRRLHAAVRDPEWGTVSGAATRRVRKNNTPHTTVIEWAIEHDRLPVQTRLTVTVTTPDTQAHRDDETQIIAEFELLAHGDVDVNRAGICLLHPLRQAGRACRASLSGADVPGRGILPELVAPQPLVDGGPAPMLGPFDALTIDDAGARLDFRFAGDLFEMEDQRNWLDASFKTYSTPLALPRPRHISAGERIRHRVDIALRPMPVDASAARGADEAGEAPIPSSNAKVSAPTRLEAVLSDPDTTVEDLRTLLAHGLDAVRIEARPGAGVARARTLIDRARQAGAEITLAVMLPEPGSSGADTAMADLTDLARRSNPALVLVFAEAGIGGTPSECTPPDLLAAATTAATAGAPATTVGGGTLFNLCEFHRHDLAHLPVGAFSLTPTVHADDPASIAETPEALPAVVATATDRLSDRPLALGPLLGTQRTLSDFAGSLGEPPPPTWVHEICSAAILLDVASLCTLDVRALVRDGQLTRHGRAALGVTNSRPSDCGTPTRPYPGAYAPGPTDGSGPRDSTEGPPP